ncbi:MAG TPA: class I SAM-dependent methyltransferase [Acidimicrobiales bacterium]|nr:class I SAM-dependent methyltransferase [Acidimicrobiales bacterium]
MAELQPPEFHAGERGSSATAHDLPRLDAMVERVRISAGNRELRRLVDLGCGYGGLSTRIGTTLGITDIVGIDADEARLAVAAERGVSTFALDLNHDALPVEDGSVSLVTSFGVLEYMVHYDNFFAEAARALEPGGFLLFSMPNLGSYSNRLALLFGYQPRDVEISSHGRLYGMLPFYGTHTTKPPHIHAATVRCMRALLTDAGFGSLEFRALAPDFGRRALRVVDRMLDPFPSVSRRFIVLATKRT